MTEPNDSPYVIVLSGPNGAGKSTAAPEILRGTMAVTEFVNADVIARGLSAFDPERVAVSAGKLMLRRLDELAAARASFAFETTLASRTFARFIRELKTPAGGGYRFHLAYFWLPAAEMAVARVGQRVRTGGHHVPELDVRRRYARGLWNFLHLYRPIADSWRLYNGGNPTGPVLIAEADGDQMQVHDAAIWDRITTENPNDQSGTVGPD